jgi:porin
MKKSLSTNPIFFLMGFTFLITNIQFAQDSVPANEKSFPFQNRLLLSGLGLNAAIIGDYFSNLSGGIQNQDAFVYNIVADALVDADRLIGMHGLNLFVSGIAISGGPFIENTGAMQGISSIAGVNHFKLFEAWIEQNLFENNFSILFGLFDLNAEFDVRESSGIFVNPSFGIGFDFAQSGQNGPSIFPYTSLALRFRISPTESFDILTAVFDGVPGSLADEKSFTVSWNEDEGALLATELMYFPGSKDFGKNYSKFSIGAWYYTSEFENTVESKYEAGNYGIYVNGEQFVYAEDSSTNQGLAVFGRFGIANSNFNLSNYSILGGVNYTGLIPTRDEDVLGMAFTSIHLTDGFASSENLKSNFETIFELTYSIQLTDWMRVQPDLQYIINPVFAIESNYAITAGVRTEIAF